MGILDTLKQYRQQNKERAIAREIEQDDQLRRDMEALQEKKKRLETRASYEKLRGEIRERKREMSWANRFKKQIGANVVKSANTPPVKPTQKAVAQKTVNPTVIVIGGSSAKPKREKIAKEADEKSEWTVGKVKRHDWSM